MVVGCCMMDLYFPESGSLKSKRQVLKSVIARLRNRFNVSVAEVDANDLWQRSVIGVAVVSNEGAHANSVLSKVIRYVEGERRLELLHHVIEMR